MAGVYGKINSRRDYERVLGEATEIAGRILGRVANNPVMQRIHQELEDDEGMESRWAGAEPRGT